MPAMYPWPKSYWQMCSTKKKRKKVKKKEKKKEEEATDPGNRRCKQEGGKGISQDDHCAPTYRADGLDCHKVPSAP